jgi:hypothetical protein
MKPYRIKHMPTGLYYKPSNGMSNLSTKGKVYMTNNCGLSNNGCGLHCSVKKESSIIKRYGEQLSKNKIGEDYKNIYYLLPLKELTKEEL